MRAVLLASATATTSGGRRRRSPITHGSALVAFERSKLALAPLIRSRRKYGLPRLDIPPRRCLPPVEFCRGIRSPRRRLRVQAGRHLLIPRFSGFDRVVGPRADIPGLEQLVAVHIPFAPFQDPDGCETMRCVVLTPGGDYETPGVHHAGRRRGRVVARGARAAAGDAGDRVSGPQIARCDLGTAAGVPPRPEGDWLCRGRERGDRISLGREPT